MSATHSELDQYLRPLNRWATSAQQAETARHVIDLIESHGRDLARLNVVIRKPSDLRSVQWTVPESRLRDLLNLCRYPDQFGLDSNKNGLFAIFDGLVKIYAPSLRARGMELVEIPMNRWKPSWFIEAIERHPSLFARARAARKGHHTALYHYASALGSVSAEALSATEQDHRQIIQALLKTGIANAADPDGITPALLCVSSGLLSRARAFHAVMGDQAIKHARTTSGENALHVAVKGEQGMNGELVDWLIDLGVDPQARDVHHNSPLVHAANQHFKASMITLLRSPSNFEDPDLVRCMKIIETSEGNPQHDQLIGMIQARLAKNAIARAAAQSDLALVAPLQHSIA